MKELLAGCHLLCKRSRYNRCNCSFHPVVKAPRPHYQTHLPIAWTHRRFDRFEIAHRTLRYSKTPKQASKAQENRQESCSHLHNQCIHYCRRCTNRWTGIHLPDQLSNKSYGKPTHCTPSKWARLVRHRCPRTQPKKGRWDHQFLRLRPSHFRCL